MHLEIREFLSQCRCARTKQNKRKRKGSGVPLEIKGIPQDIDKAYAADLYTWQGSIYLTILKLSDDRFFVLKMENKTAAEIRSLLET